MSLNKIARGTSMMFLATFARLAVQVITIPVLARYLSPEEYGVVAMALPFVFFLMMFADAGLGDSLARTVVKNKTLWISSFWVSVALSIVLSVFMLMIAPLAAYMFNEPRLTPIVATLAIAVFCMSLAAIPGASLRQEGRFEAIAGISTASLVAGTIAAIIIAVKGGGAWALVGQQLAIYGTRLVLNFWFSSFRPQFMFSFNGLKEHLYFGRNLVGIGMIAFLSDTIGTFAIASVLGTTAIGIYALALSLAHLPMKLLGGSLGFVSYTHMSHIKDNKTLLRRLFLFLTQLQSIFIFPAMGMIAVAHDPLFRLFLSDKWAEAGTIFMLLAPGTSLQSVNSLCTVITLSSGRSDLTFRIIFEAFLLWCISLLTFVWFGLEWAAFAFSLATISYLPRLLHLVLPLIDCPTSAFVKIIARPLAITAVFIGFYLVLKSWPAANDLALFSLAFGLGVVALASIIVPQYKQLRSEQEFLKST